MWVDRPMLWLSTFTSPMILTLDFQGKILKLLSLWNGRVDSLGMEGEWAGYNVGCTMGLTLGHGTWQIDRPSNGSMWNSFQPVGPWMGYSFTDLGAEGCCRSLNALLWFPRISRQTAGEVDIKICGYINYGTPQTWLPFGHAPLNLLSPGLWFVGQIPLICRQSADQFRLTFGGQTYYVPPQTWLTFGQAPLNFCCFLASDYLSSFHSFADNPVIQLGWNLKGKLIMGLPRPD